MSELKTNENETVLKTKVFLYGGLSGASVMSFRVLSIFVRNSLLHSKLETIQTPTIRRRLFSFGAKHHFLLFLLTSEEKLENVPLSNDWKKNILYQYLAHFFHYPVRFLLSRGLLRRESIENKSFPEKLLTHFIGFHVSFFGKLVYHGTSALLTSIGRKILSIEKPKEVDLLSRVMHVVGFKKDEITGQILLDREKMDEKTRRKILKTFFKKKVLEIATMLIASLLSRPFTYFPFQRYFSRDKSVKSLVKMAVAGIPYDLGIAGSQIGLQLSSIIPAYFAGLSLHNLALVLSSGEDGMKDSRKEEEEEEAYPRGNEEKNEDGIEEKICDEPNGIGSKEEENEGLEEDYSVENESQEENITPEVVKNEF